MPPSRGRSKGAPRMTAERRQEQILDSTRALTIREGYGGATMQSIAREAGVTRPVVYEFYRDRTELLKDLLAREARKVMELADSVFPAAQAGEELNETMDVTFTAFLQIAATAPETWRLVLLPPSGAPAEIREMVASIRAAVLAQIRINVLQLPAGASPDFDAELLAFALLAGSEAGARLMLSDPQRFSLGRLSEAVGWISDQITFGWP